MRICEPFGPEQRQGLHGAAIMLSKTRAGRPCAGEGQRRALSGEYAGQDQPFLRPPENFKETDLP